jgi:predicted GH43/DUF377 family glycosyl hydrolase
MRWKLFFFLLLILSTSSYLKADTTINKNRFFEIVNFDGRAFAYGPAIIQEGETYKSLFCSSGASVAAWDFLRYTDSNSWRGGALPVVLQPTSKQVGDGKNRSTCDPSIIKVNNWYYVYFTGNTKGAQASVYLSRTKDLNNQKSYELFIGRSSLGAAIWSKLGSNQEPLPIVRPINSIPDEVARQKGWYGAGQQSVVRFDSIWYMWYYDDTGNYHSSSKKINHNIYFKTSYDGINWGESSISFSCPNNSIVNRCINSVEVRYNPKSKLFIMFSIDNRHQRKSSLVFRSSRDGQNWSSKQVLCGEPCFPNFSHNLGVSGDSSGHLPFGGRVLIAFGVPYKGINQLEDDFTRPAWDLYGMYLAISQKDGSISLVGK